MRLILSLCLLGLPAALNAATLIEHPDMSAWPPSVIAGSGLRAPDNVLVDMRWKSTVPGADREMRASVLFGTESDNLILGIAISGEGHIRAF